MREGGEAGNFQLDLPPSYIHITDYEPNERHHTYHSPLTHHASHITHPGGLMPYAIYDYRHDIRNFVITPQLRSRFLRMEPGEVHGRHSHDLGHEIFLILQGRCRMEIDGDVAVLE